MAISKGLRFAILHRDRFMCQYCGARPGKAQLEVDHVISRYHGGSDHPSNLVAACGPCNRGKSARSIDLKKIRDSIAADDAEERFMRMDYEKPKPTIVVHHDFAYEDRILHEVEKAHNRTFYRELYGRQSRLEAAAEITYDASEWHDCIWLEQQAEIEEGAA